MKLGIIGSRTLDGEPVRALIEAAIKQHGATVIVTAGEAAGVAEEARDLAKRHAITLHLHFANRKTKGRGMYHHRNAALLNDCERALFIHDGESKGTANAIELVKQMGLPYECHQLEPQPHITTIP